MNTDLSLHIHVLVVFYCLRFEHSPSYQSLLEQDTGSADVRLSLTLWNNSPKAFDMGDWKACTDHFDEVQYVHTPENERLPRIYNRVLQREDADIFMIMDHDTRLPQDYIRVALENLKAFPAAPVYVPMIPGREGHRLVSPSFLDHRKVVPGRQSAKGFKGVASGLLINKFVARQCLFDERFTLYGADVDFCRQISERYDELLILPLQLEHEFSKELQETTETTRWRRLERIRAGIILSKKYKSKSRYRWRLGRHFLQESFNSLRWWDATHFKHTLEVIHYTSSCRGGAG